MLRFNNEGYSNVETVLRILILTNCSILIGTVKTCQRTYRIPSMHALLSVSTSILEIPLDSYVGKMQCIFKMMPRTAFNESENIMENHFIDSSE